MTSEIEIPFPNGPTLVNKQALRNVIVDKTGREPYIERKERSIIVQPESPTHADQILHLFEEEMDLEVHYE